MLHLAHLRASQINGCGFCVDIGTKHAKQDGESDERLHAVAGWREAPYFTDAERAAFALSEAVTTLDARDPVPDSVWNEAAKHFDEKQLAALVLWIGTVNFFNRANIATRQPAGQPLPRLIRGYLGPAGRRLRDQDAPCVTNGTCATSLE